MNATPTIIQNSAAITNNFYSGGYDGNQRYYDSRKWSDRFIPAMNNASYALLIRNDLIKPTFREPSLLQDWDQGIDSLLVFDSINLSYRTRGYSSSYFYKQGFTLRNTEISKIMSGKYNADFLLYALESKQGDYSLESAYLIDMKKVSFFLRSDPSLVDQGEGVNNFVDFGYDAFPASVVAGYISYVQ